MLVCIVSMAASGNKVCKLCLPLFLIMSILARQQYLRIVNQAKETDRVNLQVISLR